jgi:hypothetical protein
MRLLAFPVAERTWVSGQVDLYAAHNGTIRPAAETAEGPAASACMGLGFSQGSLVWRSRPMSEGKPPLAAPARSTNGGSRTGEGLGPAVPSAAQL